jgi:MFS family permease
LATVEKSTNWFLGMSTRERQTFWGCFAGWALDAMDVQLYALVMPTLIGLWGLTRGQAGVLSTSALVVSSLGGWIAGVLADRIGRARVLRITIIWFATFTFLSGFTHSYTQLLVARSLQGLGFGGEWAAGAVLMGEVIDRRFRGRAVGTVQSGWSVGYGVAVLLFTAVFSFVSADYAWRVLFFIGLPPALLVLWMCRGIEEPEIFRKQQKTRSSQPKASLWEIFHPNLIRSTLVAALLATGGLGGNYTILTWLPTYLKTVRGLSVLNTGGYLAVNILGSFCGYLASAHLSDWLGRRRTFVLMALCAAATIAVYTLLPLNSTFVLILGFPIGFFQSGIVSGMGAAFAELFPTRVRATGQGFSYNAGRGIGSAMPALVGYLSAVIPLTQAIAVCAIASYSVVLLGTLLLRETRGRELDFDSK